MILAILWWFSFRTIAELPIAIGLCCACWRSLYLNHAINYYADTRELSLWWSISLPRGTDNILFSFFRYLIWKIINMCRSFCNLNFKGSFCSHKWQIETGGMAFLGSTVSGTLYFRLLSFDQHIIFLLPISMAPPVVTPINYYLQKLWDYVLQLLSVLYSPPVVLIFHQ